MPRGRPRQRADRPAHRQPGLLDSRRRAATGTGGRHRRTVPGRRRPGPGLPPPPGVDRRTLHDQPVRRWCTPVPHRRPGLLPRRRCDRIPWPYRPSGEDSRPAHRTGRDRDPPDGTRQRARSRGRGRRRPARPATGGLRGAQRGGGECAVRTVARNTQDATDDQPRRLHGADPVAVS
ncbi:hypothetical protein D3C85_1013390 [compost metagenome]